MFLTGCLFDCVDCHNKHLQTHNSDHFSLSSTDNVESLLSEIMIMLDRIKTKNIVILGGDPFYPDNVIVTEFLSKNLTYNGMNVMIYTGYTVDYIKTLDVSFTYLKCGLYENKLSQTPKLKSDSFTLSSTNQQIFDSKFNLLSDNGVMYF